MKQYLLLLTTQIIKIFLLTLYEGRFTCSTVVLVNFCLTKSLLNRFLRTNQPIPSKSLDPTFTSIV